CAAFVCRTLNKFGYNGSCRGVAQPGSAPALGAGGRRFKSSRPDQFHLSTFPKLERSGRYKFRFRKEHFARKPLSPEIKAHHNLRIQNTCLVQLSANVCILVGLLRMGSEAAPRRKASGLQKMSDTASYRELPAIL